MKGLSLLISMAPYRDPDCLNTVRDLFSKAAIPERLTFGICWQCAPGCDQPYFETPDLQGRIRQIAIPPRTIAGRVGHAPESSFSGKGKHTTCKWTATCALSRIGTSC